SQEVGLGGRITADVMTRESLLHGGPASSRAKPGPATLRVMLLNEFFHPDAQGGTATATSNIARALHDGAHAEVTVIASRHAYRDPTIRYAPEENWRGIKIQRATAPNWLRKSTPVRL